MSPDILTECIDGAGHTWDSGEIRIDPHGRTWESIGCTKCNTGSVRLLYSTEDNMQAFLDLLALAQEHRER